MGETNKSMKPDSVYSTAPLTTLFVLRKPPQNDIGFGHRVSL